MGSRGGTSYFHDDGDGVKQVDLGLMRNLLINILCHGGSEDLL
jgi:hypothetical protein